MGKLDTLQLNKYNSVGAIHIHSVYSDGTGNVDLISNAAKKAGLDWIIITDHNSFEIQEGIYNGVYVIKGEEISPKNENHYLKKKYIPQAAQFKMKQLEDALKACVEAEEAVKTGRMSDVLSVELIIVGLSSRKDDLK